MPEKPAIKLDLDNVLETLLKGVRRATIFMGVGTNAAEVQPPISPLLAHDAKDAFEIRLVKEDYSDAERAHIAEEFGKWICANGLRELLESFSIFLYQLYTAAFLLNRRDGKPLAGILAPQKFERLGIGEQLKMLAQILPVSDTQIEVISSLNRLRNCYVHRHGVVGGADIEAPSGLFTIKWTAIAIEGVEPDGKVIPEQELKGRLFPRGGTIQGRVVRREASFRLGNQIVLGKRQLKEICACVLPIGQWLFQQLVVKAREQGVLLELPPLETEANSPAHTPSSPSPGAR